MKQGEKNMSSGSVGPYQQWNQLIPVWGRRVPSLRACAQREREREEGRYLRSLGELVQFGKRSEIPPLGGIYVPVECESPKLPKRSLHCWYSNGNRLFLAGSKLGSKNTQMHTNGEALPPPRVHRGHWCYSLLFPVRRPSFPPELLGRWWSRRCRRERNFERKSYRWPSSSSVTNLLLVKITNGIICNEITLLIFSFSLSLSLSL